MGDTETADLIARLEAAEARLARLEARDAVLALFNDYLYSIDVGYPEELMEDVFTVDAVLELTNFPPGTMGDVLLNGRAEIAPLYRDHTRTPPAVQGGHHASNIAVEVAPDGTRAHLSAYFLTSGGGGGGYAQGGQYQGEAVLDDDGRWRFRHWRVISGWGWRVDQGSFVMTTESIPAERAWRGARPAGSSRS